jgi:hypothetical protein
MLAELGDGDRSAASDAPSQVLLRRSHVEDDDGPVGEASGELVAVDDLDAVVPMPAEAAAGMRGRFARPSGSIPRAWLRRDR